MRIKEEGRHKVTKAQSDKGKEKCSVPLCLCASVPNNRGFTLMELMVVIAIIILLAGIMVPNLANRIERAKITKAEADISSIEGAIAMYENDIGRYPESENTSGWESIEVLAWRLTGRRPLPPVSDGMTENSIINDPNWHGPYIKGIEQDPWKKDYVYIKNRNPRQLTSLPLPLNATQYPVNTGDPHYDYPDAGYGGSVGAPDNLSYYIFSLGRNKDTGSAALCEDDINNWDVNKKWREAK